MGSSGPLSPEPAPELLQAVRAGAPEAIDRWYRSEHPSVWKLCLGFLADGNEAEDVAQDAMLHLLDHLDRYDGKRPWISWRNTVVLNLCRDRLRRRDARRRAVEQKGAAQLPQTMPDPSHTAERKELAEALQAALAALTEREREAFVLRELEGHPTAEVARVLGIEEGSVRSLLVLARRRLRRVLGPRLGCGESHD